MNVRTVPVHELVDDVADRLGPAIRQHTIERDVPVDLEVELDQIFDPFFRSGDVLHRETRGLGVGLAVVAGLVRALGARIQVASDPGTGSRFTVYVPASASASAAPGARDRASSQVTSV